MRNGRGTGMRADQVARIGPEDRAGRAAGPRSVPGLAPGLALALALALAGCGMAPEGMTGTGMVADPYADLPNGGARYTGTLGADASATLPGTATQEGFAASAGDTLHFAEGQVALSDAARQTVAAQAHWLMQNRGFAAVIEGHADEPGTREYNLALGARRAAAVQDYLIANGIEAGRISTVTYGRERPLAGCTGGDCTALNRRVIVRVAPGSGA